MQTAQQQWEYCIVEWIWNANSIRINLPDGVEDTQPGSYAELVQVLNQLGSDGWQATTCAAQGNWLFWTLKRPADR